MNILKNFIHILNFKKQNHVERQYWKGLTVYLHHNIQNDDEHYNPKLSKFFNNSFPSFYDHIQMLPFESVTRIQLWENVLPVPLHKDVNIPPNNSEYNFRIMLLNDNNHRNFMISFNNQYFYPKWNRGSNTFVYNNVLASHGSLMPTGRKILAVISRDININKCNKLICQSFEKYKDYAWVF